MSEREAGGSVVRLEGLAELEEPGRVLWKLLETGLFRSRDAVVDEGAGDRDRNRDPFAPGFSVGFRRGGPAAVLLAEIVGDVGDVEALLREQMRQRVKAPHHVEALPSVGGNRCLRLHV